MKYLYLCVVINLLSLIHSELYSQCTPDPAVTDPEGNGEIYPLNLIFKAGNPVNMKLTIIPPPTAVVDGLGTINLAKIVLRNISSKPSWMSYSSNAAWVSSGTGTPQPQGYEFIVGQRYCMQLTGTPNSTFIGTDSMGVVVDAYVSYGLIKENTNGGYIRYTICSQNDTSCIPTQGEINPYELQFKENIDLSNLKMSYAPPSQIYYNGSNINLSKIILRNISGMPTWLNYTINTIPVSSSYELTIGKKYAITFNGIPNNTYIGNDTLKFIADIYNTAIPPVLIANNVEVSTVKFNICAANDSTCHPTNITTVSSNKFQPLKSNPSFLNIDSKIGFETNSIKKSELNIYNILGQLIYSEKINSIIGKNYFQFDGNCLNKGNYIYTITDYTNKFSNRFFKE